MTPSQTAQQIQALREAGHVHTAQALTDLYLSEQRSRPVFQRPGALGEVPPRSVTHSKIMAKMAGQPPYTHEQMMSTGIEWPCNWLKPGQPHPSDKEAVRRYLASEPTSEQALADYYKANGLTTE